MYIHTCKDKLTIIPEPASIFEANANLPKSMSLVSTWLYFPRTNFIHLLCSYQKRKATGDGQNADPQSMDSPDGLPLKWTAPKNNIQNEYCLKL